MSGRGRITLSTRVRVLPRKIKSATVLDYNRIEHQYMKPKSMPARQTGEKITNPLR